jgi:hypothetical protein
MRVGDKRRVGRGTHWWTPFSEGETGPPIVNLQALRPSPGQLPEPSIEGRRQLSDRRS